MSNDTDCTDCEGSGICHQTERYCTCGAGHALQVGAALALPEIAALVEAARPFVSPVQNADYKRQLREFEALRAALAAIEAAMGATE